MSVKDTDGDPQWYFPPEGPIQSEFKPPDWGKTAEL